MPLPKKMVQLLANDLHFKSFQNYLGFFRGGVGAGGGGGRRSGILGEQRLWLGSVRK